MLGVRVFRVFIVLGVQGAWCLVCCVFWVLSVQGAVWSGCCVFRVLGYSVYLWCWVLSVFRVFQEVGVMGV